MKCEGNRQEFHEIEYRKKILTQHFSKNYIKDIVLKLKEGKNEL